MAAASPSAACAAASPLLPTAATAAASTSTPTKCDLRSPGSRSEGAMAGGGGGGGQGGVDGAAQGTYVVVSLRDDQVEDEEVVVEVGTAGGDTPGVIRVYWWMQPVPEGAPPLSQGPAPFPYEFISPRALSRGQYDYWFDYIGEVRAGPGSPAACHYDYHGDDSLSQGQVDELRQRWVRMGAGGAGGCLVGVCLCGEGTSRCMRACVHACGMSVCVEGGHIEVHAYVCAWHVSLCGEGHNEVQVCTHAWHVCLCVGGGHMKVHVCVHAVCVGGRAHRGACLWVCFAWKLSSIASVYLLVAVWACPNPL